MILDSNNKPISNEILKEKEFIPSVFKSGLEAKKIDDKADEKDKVIQIMEKYLELIIDLGFDYDGLNTVESLKALIDEIVRYAKLGRAYNITEPIFINEKNKFNILGEEIKNGIYQDRKELHDKEQPKHNSNRRRKT